MKYRYDLLSVKKIVETLGDIPAPRSGHATIRFGRTMYMFGGFDRNIVLPGLYAYDLDTFEWRLVETSGSIPPARTSHSFVVDEENGLAYVICGSGPDFGHSNMNDVYELNLHFFTWRQLFFADSGVTLHPRYGQSVVYYKRKLFLFGGTFGTQFSNELFLFDLETLEMSPINSNDGPVGRYKHAAEIMGTEMVVYGGAGANSYQLCDLYLFDLNKYTWRAVLPLPQEMIFGRFAHVMQVIGRKVFVYSGTNRDAIKNNMFCIDLNDPNKAIFSRIDTATVPCGRYFHAAVYDPLYSNWIIFGGKISVQQQKRVNDMQCVSLRTFAQEETDAISHCTLSQDILALYRRSDRFDFNFYSSLGDSGFSSLAPEEYKLFPVHSLILYARVAKLRPYLFQHLGSHTVVASNGLEPPMAMDIDSLELKNQNNFGLCYRNEVIRTFIEFLYSDSLRLVYESDVLATCLSNPSSVFSSTMEKAGLSFSAPVESNKVVSSQILTIPPFRNLPLDHYVDVILLAQELEIPRLAWLAECRIRVHMTQQFARSILGDSKLINASPSLGLFASNFLSENERSKQHANEFNRLFLRRLELGRVEEDSDEDMPGVAPRNPIQLQHFGQIQRLIQMHVDIQNQQRNHHARDMDIFRTHHPNPDHIAQFSLLQGQQMEQLIRHQQEQLQRLQQSHLEEERLHSSQNSSVAASFDDSASFLNDSEEQLELDSANLVEKVEMYYNAKLCENESLTSFHQNNSSSVLAIDLLLLRKAPYLNEQDFCIQTDSTFRFIDPQFPSVIHSALFAHRLLLEARTHYFGNCSFAGMKEATDGFVIDLPMIGVEQVSPNNLNLLLDYIYGGELALQIACLNSLPCILEKNVEVLSKSILSPSHLKGLEYNVSLSGKSSVPVLDSSLALEILTFDATNYYGFTNSHLTEFLERVLATDICRKVQSAPNATPAIVEESDEAVEDSSANLCSRISQLLMIKNIPFKFFSSRLVESLRYMFDRTSSSQVDTCHDVLDQNKFYQVPAISCILMKSESFLKLMHAVFAERTLRSRQL